MDWIKLLGAGSGILGLAVVFATLSMRGFVRRFASDSSNIFWPKKADDWPFYVGALLIVASEAANSDSLVETCVWLVVGFAIILLWLSGRRESLSPTIPDPAPPATQVTTQALATGHIRLIALWLSKRELIWLALLAVFFLNPDHGRWLVLVTLPLLWLIRRVASGHFVPATPLDWPITLMMVMILVSVFATFDINVSIGKIAALLFGIALYYAIVAWVDTAHKLVWAVRVYLLAGLGLAIVGLLATNWASKFSLLSPILQRLPRVLTNVDSSQGIHPAEVAGALLWFVPLQLTLLVFLWPSFRSISSRGKAKWLALLGVAALSVGTLVLTQSRSALLGLGAAILLLLFVKFPRARVAVVGATVVALCLLTLAPSLLSDPLLNTQGQVVPGSSALSAGIGRVEIWQQAIYAIEDHPLTGLGMNVFRYWLPLVDPQLDANRAIDLAHAHNHLLQTALDLGLPGLVSYVAIWLLAGVLCFQAVGGARNDLQRRTALGVGAGLLAYFIYGLTDTVALGAKPSFMFWALLAILAVTWRDSLYGKERFDRDELKVTAVSAREPQRASI